MLINPKSCVQHKLTFKSRALGVALYITGCSLLIKWEAKWGGRCGSWSTLLSWEIDCSHSPFRSSFTFILCLVCCGLFVSSSEHSQLRWLFISVRNTFWNVTIQWFFYIRAKMKSGHYLHMCSIWDMSISETVPKLVYFVDFMFLLYWVGTVMTRNMRYNILVVILVFFCFFPFPPYHRK